MGKPTERVLKVVTFVHVDESFDMRDRNIDGIVQFISGTLDNSPDPEEIDDSLKGVSIGISYYDGLEES